VIIINQRQQKMLQGRIFMFAAGGSPQRIVECGFKFTRERRHLKAPYFHNVGCGRPEIKPNAKTVTT
jgi:hypothetical protein